MATLTLTTAAGTATQTLSTGARGPTGSGGGGGSITVDTTVTDGSANAVSGNAVFDALALKAPLASPVFTGSVTTSGDYAKISTDGYYATIYTNGYNATIHTTGQDGHIFTTGTSATIYTGGDGAPIYTTGNSSLIYTNGDVAHISTTGANAHIQSRSTFKLFNGTHTTTLSHAPTGDRNISLPNAGGTLALTTDIPAAPTAASLAAALNAGTQDSTAADTDRLAVTSPAGGWMLLSTIWTWLKTKLSTSGETITVNGPLIISSATRPTSSGSGVPDAASLITLADMTDFVSARTLTTPINFALCTTNVAAGGTSNTSRGAWQLFTGVTASSLAHVYADTGYFSSTVNFDRRIIVRTTLRENALRAGLQFYCQLGRAIASGTAAQLANKGFGFGITGSTVTPFVHNGTSLTTTLATGATFSQLTYPSIILDFKPGVALEIWGIPTTSSTPVQLCTITSGLPSGAITGANRQLEWLKYDTGSGGANDWTYLGHSSITII